MRLLLLFVCGLGGPTISAQAPTAKAIGSWVIEYERVITRMHAEPIKVVEHARLLLRSNADSVAGDLIVPTASADSSRYVVRGVKKGDLVTLLAEEPRPVGLSVLMVPIDAAVDWLREAVHGVGPTEIRFELVIGRDSVAGSRIASGFPNRTPQTTAVRGRIVR